LTYNYSLIKIIIIKNYFKCSMAHTMSESHFSDILEAVDKLSLDEQRVFLDIVTHRLAETARKKLVEDIHEARKDFSNGLCKPATSQKIMDEIIF
jgi:hypothetical protein